MQALVLRISRYVYVLDITVNFMLNKRKSKKAAEASPQTPLKEQSALPQTPLLSREGERLLPYPPPPPPPPPPVLNIFMTPPFPKILVCYRHVTIIGENVHACNLIVHST